MTRTTEIHPLPPELAGMPCCPASIQVQRYALPGCLGKAELEEAAARILLFSVESGGWTGVSWLQILRRLEEENRMQSHERPLTLLRIYTFDVLVSAFHVLVNERYISLDEKDGVTVFYPTPTLIARILQAQ